jgi:hypothetical protein
VVLLTLTTRIMFLLFTCKHFRVEKFYEGELTVYEVVRDCRKFEKHWSRGMEAKVPVVWLKLYFDIT